MSNNEKEFDLMKEHFGVTSNSINYSSEVEKKVGVIKYNPDIIANTATYAAGNTKEVHEKTQEKLKEEKEEKISYEKVTQKNNQKQVEEVVEESFEKDFQKEYEAFLKQKEAFEKEVEEKKSELKDKERKLKINNEATNEKTKNDYKLEEIDEKMDKIQGREEELKNTGITKENANEDTFSFKLENVSVSESVFEQTKEEKEKQSDFKEETKEDFAEDFLAKRTGYALDEYHEEAYSKKPDYSKDTIMAFGAQAMKDIKVLDPEHGKQTENFARTQSRAMSSIDRQHEMQTGMSQSREKDGGMSYR